VGLHTAPLGLQSAPRSPTGLAWSRKVSSLCEPPRRGTTGVLMKERLYVLEREDLRTSASPDDWSIQRQERDGIKASTLRACTRRFTSPCG
jgi:hypothetical protein